MTCWYGLLRNLYVFGFHGNSGSVTFRDIFVQVNRVPQGSVLSPRLFLYMVNDIITALPWNLKYSLYADGCALWHSSSKAEFLENHIQLALVILIVYKFARFGYWKYTRIHCLEEESGVPPLWLRCGQLTLTYTMKVVQDLRHLDFNGGIRPFTTRIHNLIQKVGMDFPPIDTLAQTIKVPWETPTSKPWKL